jgi:hypothetical protein
MRHPAYHLRTNKAVDRLLLVDVLRALEADERFTYYSLSGPFLEDIRIMDHFFPAMRLVSLERDDDTFQRQVFHQFSSRIVLHRPKLGRFLTNDYEPGNQDVFWLDYTGLEYALFEEFEAVLKAVPNGSVVRITLRASPKLDLRLIDRRVSATVLAALREQIEKDFESEFGKILPHSAAGALASLDNFARMVQLMVRLTASRALDFVGSDREFLVVQSTRYNDGTQMVSVTGIVCGRAEVNEVRQLLNNVRFADFDWKNPVEINVPALSAKERLGLERYLPLPVGTDAGVELQARLGYKIDFTDSTSRRKLAQYADFHREYPQFVRVAL